MNTPKEVILPEYSQAQIQIWLLELEEIRNKK
jgi:hypothetical protein